MKVAIHCLVPTDPARLARLVSAFSEEPGDFRAVVAMSDAAWLAKPDFTALLAPLEAAPETYVIGMRDDGGTGLRAASWRVAAGLLREVAEWAGASAIRRATAVACPASLFRAGDLLLRDPPTELRDRARVVVARGGAEALGEPSSSFGGLFNDVFASMSDPFGSWPRWLASGAACLALMAVLCVGTFRFPVAAALLLASSCVTAGARAGLLGFAQFLAALALSLYLQSIWRFFRVIGSFRERGAGSEPLSSELERNLRETDGWLSRKEAGFLFAAARACPEGRVIVELGSWKGRSAITLGLGSRGGGGCPVHCVDRFQEEATSWFVTRGSCRPEFEANVKAFGLGDLVIPLESSFADAARSASRDCGLLFIDGSHFVWDVWRDYSAWADKIVAGGMIAFHDTSTMMLHLGPNLVTAWLLLFSGRVRNPRLLGTITALESVERASVADRLRNIAFLFLRPLLRLRSMVRADDDIWSHRPTQRTECRAKT